MSDASIVERAWWWRGRWWLVAGGLGIVLALLGGWQVRRTLYAPLQLDKPQSVIVARRTRLREVARKLQQERLIPSAFALQVYGRLTNKAKQLKAGEYEVTSGMTPVDILDLLISGRVKAYWVTIPEGKWAREIPGFLTTHWPGVGADFQRWVAQPQHWAGRVPFPLPTESLEGYLFPDTYLFGKDVSAEQIITAMLDRCSRVCWAAYRENPPADGRSFHDVLVLASLVEAEARRDDERSTIARVYLNRLRLPRPMTLDCDATLIYARGERIKRVLNQDKLIDSPYNTYKYAGLPPGPICNPGRASMLAALKPAENVPYLYYVARGDGSHIFSRTLAEHEAAIHQVRGK